MDKIKKALHTLELANLAGEDIQKARVTKYYRREGGPGNYKYYYTKAEWDKAKGVKKEGSKKIPKEGLVKDREVKKVTWIEDYVDEDTGEVYAQPKESEFLTESEMKSLKQKYEDKYREYKDLAREVERPQEQWDEKRYDLEYKVVVLESEIDSIRRQIADINMEMEANVPEGHNTDEYAEEWTLRVSDFETERMELENELHDVKKELDNHMSSKYPEASEESLNKIEKLEKEVFDIREEIVKQNKLGKIKSLYEDLTGLVSNPPEGFFEEVEELVGFPEDDGESESALVDRIFSGVSIGMVEDFVERNKEKSKSLEQGFSPNQLEDYIYDNEDKIRDNFKSYGWSGKDVDNLKKNYIDLANVLGVDSRVVKDIDHSYAVDMLKDLLDLRKAEYLGALQELGLDIEKGRTREGVYANTSENRKLGRVGQKYKKKDSVEDKKEGKKESSSPKERDLTGMVVNDVIDDIEKDISKFWRINAVDTSPLGGTFKRIHFSSLEWSNPIREYIKGKYGVDPELEHNVRAGSVTLKIPKESIVNMRKYLTDKEFRQSVSEQARHGTLVGGKGRPVRS